MAQAGVAYVTIQPDWKGFNQSLRKTAPSFDREFQAMGSRIGRGFASLGHDAGAVFARSMSTAAKVGLGTAVAGITASVKVAADFEQQLSSLGSVADASAKQMDALRQAALKAGADTAFSALDAAKAQTELAKGGLKTSQILKGGLSAALSLAAAGQLDLADAASTTVNAMKLFGIQGGKAGKVADALATAANTTTADVSDFALALSQAGSAAKTVGLSFPETVTALETLADVGIKGSDAGTSLKTMLVQLASPTSKQAKDTAKQLGLNLFDAQGKMKSLVGVSAELQGAFGGLTQKQRIQAATTLVGQDGFRALLALYDAGPQKVAKMERQLDKSGTAAEVAKKKQDNLKGSLEQLGGSVQTVGIQIGTEMIPAIRKGADELTGFSNHVSKILSDKDLSLGEKLNESLRVAKVDLTPWAHKFEQAIVGADIPGDIGRLLDGVTGRIGQGVDAGGFIDKISAQIRDADLAGKLGDLVSAAVPKIAEAAGRAGAGAAGAFARSFIAADAWGKLALGGWLLTKMGGLSAFASLGKRAGGAMAAGAATGVAAGGAAGAAGGAGRTASALSRASSALPFAGAAIIGAESILKGENTRVAGEQLKFINDQIDRMVKSGDSAGLRQFATNFAQGPGKLKDQAKQIVAQMSGLADKIEGIHRLAAHGIRLDLDSRPTAEGAKEVANALDRMKSMSSTSIREMRRTVSQNTRLIKHDLGSDTSAGKEALSANFAEAANNIRSSMAAGTISTKKGTAEIERLMLKSLEAVGFTKAQAIRLRNGQDPDSGKSQTTLGGKQSGGMVVSGGHATVPGSGSGDKVHLQAMVEPGEQVYVLNRNASKRLRMLQALNAAVPRFQRGGLLHLAAGGYPGVTGDTDFLPAVGNALSAMSRAANTPIFVQSGRRTVAEQLAQGPSTPDHPVAGPNGPHVRGVAADITPGYGTFHALAGKFGLGFTVMPQEPWHVQLLNAAAAVGAGAGVSVPQLRRVLADGPDSPLKSIVQGALDTARAGAQGLVQKAADAAAAFSGGESSPGDVQVTGDLESVDHVYPRHNLGEPGVRFSPDLVTRIAQSQGLPGRSFEQIAHGESDYHPGIIGHDPGGTLGYGLFQNTTSVNGPAFEAVVNRLGGWAQQLNPIKNAVAAKWLFDRGGFSHWFGTKYLTAGSDRAPGGHFLTGGIMEALATGGAVKGQRSRADELGWLTSQWQRVAPVFGLDPSKRPLPSLFKHLRLSGANAFVGVASDVGARGHGTDELLWPSWLWRDSKDQKALDDTTKLKLFVHEMTHRFQDRAATASDWKSEGGAEAFARLAMDRFFGGYKRDTGDPYSGYVTRVMRKLGVDWVLHGQFGQKATKKMLGGLVGLQDGGAPEKGLRTPSAAAINLDRALKSIRTGRSEKIRNNRTSRLLSAIGRIGFDAQQQLLTRLSGQADIQGEYANRAGQLTDTGKITDALQTELVRREGISPRPSPLFPPDAQQQIVDAMQARVNGDTQLGWLVKQVGSLFDWRNVLVDTEPIVAQLRTRTDVLLTDAQAKLAALVKQIADTEKKIAKLEKERDKVSRREDTLTGRIKDEMGKPAKKRDEAKLKAWRAELGDKHGRHVAINTELSKLHGENRARAAEQDALQRDGGVIDTLTGRRDDLASSVTDIAQNITDVQGAGSPMNHLQTLPVIGVLGGKLFDTQKLIQDLTDNPPRVDTTVDNSAQDQAASQRADLLQGLLNEANLRTTISERAFSVLRNADLPPYGGSYKTGGVVPGPVGEPRTIIAHAGETVVPVGAAGGGDTRVHVNVANGMEWLTRFIDTRVEKVTRQQSRMSARALPGIGGGGIR